MKSSTPIAFETARRIAEDAARRELRDFVSPSTIEVLSPEYLEAEGCWIFFKSDEISLPTFSQGLSPFTAYAVSRLGEYASVYDFRTNKQQMNDYLEFWSLHALGKSDEAKSAVRVFIERYPIGNV